MRSLLFMRDNHKNEKFSLFFDAGDNEDIALWEVELENQREKGEKLCENEEKVEICRKVETRKGSM